MGAIQIRFLLGPTRQRSLRIREWLTWLASGGSLSLAQVALIYWLLGWSAIRCCSTTDSREPFSAGNGEPP